MSPTRTISFFFALLDIELEEVLLALLAQRCQFGRVTRDLIAQHSFDVDQIPTAGRKVLTSRFQIRCHGFYIAGHRGDLRIGVLLDLSNLGCSLCAGSRDVCCHFGGVRFRGKRACELLLFLQCLLVLLTQLFGHCTRGGKILVRYSDLLGDYVRDRKPSQWC